ncbi:hypothetical protein ACTFIZ_000919 [Dictyostelium cf. discoideum]
MEFLYNVSYDSEFEEIHFDKNHIFKLKVEGDIENFSIEEIKPLFDQPNDNDLYLNDRIIEFEMKKLEKEYNEIIFTSTHTYNLIFGMDIAYGEKAQIETKFLECTSWPVKEIEYKKKKFISFIINTEGNHWSSVFVYIGGDTHVYFGIDSLNSNLGGYIKNINLFLRSKVRNFQQTDLIRNQLKSKSIIMMLNCKKQKDSYSCGDHTLIFQQIFSKNHKIIEETINNCFKNKNSNNIKCELNSLQLFDCDKIQSKILAKRPQILSRLMNNSSIDLSFLKDKKVYFSQVQKKKTHPIDTEKEQPVGDDFEIFESAINNINRQFGYFKEMKKKIKSETNTFPNLNNIDPRTNFKKIKTNSIGTKFRSKKKLMTWFLLDDRISKKLKRCNYISMDRLEQSIKEKTTILTTKKVYKKERIELLSLVKWNVITGFHWDVLNKIIESSFESIRKNTIRSVLNPLYILMLILCYIKIGPGRMVTLSEIFKIDPSTVSKYLKKYVPIILSTLWFIDIKTINRERWLAVDCTSHLINRVHPGQYFYYRTGVGHYINSQTLVDLNKTLRMVVFARGHMNDPSLSFYSGLVDLVKEENLSVLGDSAYDSRIFTTPSSLYKQSNPNLSNDEYLMLKKFYETHQSILRSPVEHVNAHIKKYLIAVNKNNLPPELSCQLLMILYQSLYLDSIFRTTRC